MTTISPEDRQQQFKNDPVNDPVPDLQKDLKGHWEIITNPSEPL